MPAKKKRLAGPDVPDDSTAWRAVLEDIRSQNRTTLEAVHTSHHRLTDQIRELREQSDSRFEMTMTAIRDVRANLKAEISGVRADLKAEISGVKADLKAEISGVKADLKAEMSGVKADLEAEISSVKADLKAEISGVKTDLEAEISSVKTDLKADLIRVEAKVDKLTSLEGRVAALEHRGA